MSQNFSARPRPTDSEKALIVDRIEKRQQYGVVSYAEACREHGVALSTFQRWRKAIKGERQPAKRPKTPGRTLTAETQKLIIELAQDPRHTSGASVARAVREAGVAVGDATVLKILRDAGIYHQIKRRGRP
ncbi:transposase [Billgrantia sp. LNSP4103-1]|uniref:transposase n=1 Tax=Billgrantia sp. LNSP4103-1 TaxID=3410266 RepID=UPI00403F8216